MILVRIDSRRNILVKITNQTFCQFVVFYFVLNVLQVVNCRVYECNYPSFKVKAFRNSYLCSGPWPKAFCIILNGLAFLITLDIEIFFSFLSGIGTPTQRHGILSKMR